jgi:S-adenosylmethionine hydrolase
MRDILIKAGMFLLLALGGLRAESVLVLQTDFGTKDGAVAAMKGVAVGVSPRLVIHDLSHENTPYDIWEAAYRLKQTVPYWPAGTVFVSVVDPGVGTARKSVVLEIRSGHFFVGPDNGMWTLIAEDLGIAAVREIDESRHRRAGSAKSYTFHGRDIYAYVGARLAAGQVAFADIGPQLPDAVVRLAYESPREEAGGLIGTIPALDFQYGNVWTNLDEPLFARLKPRPGERFKVTIAEGGRVVYAGEMPYVHTFGDVPEGAPLLYLNSLLNVSFALNMGSFARKHGIASGAAWSVRIERVQP